MKLHRYLIAAALALGLAACASEYTESEAPKHLTLSDATAHVDVRFAGGSSQLVARDAGRLQALAASGAIDPSDVVTVSPGGPPALARDRVRSVAAVLLPYRIVVSQRQLAGVPPDRAIIQTGRYLVSLPPCPNWSKWSTLDMTNAHASNFGCTTANNLGMMVASPADLVGGRPVGLADALPAVAAVNRYRTDNVQLPAAATVGPIGAPQTGAPTGGGAETAP
jgi:pilus assembly protein CpaD